MVEHLGTALRYVSFFCLLAALAIAGAAQEAPSSVMLFNGPDGTGAKQEIPLGSFVVNGKQLGGSPDKEPELSVQVPKGVLIRFCEDKSAGAEGGKCQEFGEGIHNLTSANFSSLKVWLQSSESQSPSQAPPPQPVPISSQSAVPGVLAFEALNWGGRSQPFVPGMYRSIKGEFGRINDNMVKSVIVAKGYHARFCSFEGYNGRGSGDCEEYGEGRYNLRFSNDISFIEVKDLSDHSPPDDKLPVVLYEDGSQGGKMQGFEPGVYLGSQGQLGKVGNNKASSIAVKDGYRVTVCADEGTAGAAPDNCEDWGPGKHNLKFKGEASYLKVLKDEK